MSIGGTHGSDFSRIGPSNEAPQRAAPTGDKEVIKALKGEISEAKMVKSQLIYHALQEKGVTIKEGKYLEGHFNLETINKRLESAEDTLKAEKKAEKALLPSTAKTSILDKIFSKLSNLLGKATEKPAIASWAKTTVREAAKPLGLVKDTHEEIIAKYEKRRDEISGPEYDPAKMGSVESYKIDVQMKLMGLVKSTIKDLGECARKEPDKEKRTEIEKKIVKMENEDMKAFQTMWDGTARDKFE